MNTIEFRTMLVDPASAGAYFVDSRDVGAMTAAAASLDFTVARIDLAGCVDKEGSLARIGETLQFPDWFGANWDALADCLGDLSWLPGPGYLVVLDNSGQWQTASRDGFDTLLAILNEVSTDWCERNVPFWAMCPLPAESLENLER